MKRFEFRLESVLRLREAQLDAERAKLQQLIAEDRRIIAALDAIKTERREAKAFLCNRSGLDAVELRNIGSFLLGMDVKTGTLSEKRLEIGRRIEQQRKVVVQAERNSRLLTKLRDRKRSEWQYEADREIETIAQDAWTAAHFGGKHTKPETP